METSTTERKRVRLKSQKSKTPGWFKKIGPALVRSGKTARKIAKMYGTPVYVLKNGKIVAEKP